MMCHFERYLLVHLLQSYNTISHNFQVLPKMPKKKDCHRTIVISCVDDTKACKKARKRGMTIVDPEFILTGILRQQVDVDTFALSLQ